MCALTPLRMTVLALVLGAGALARADGATGTSAAPEHYDAGRTYFQAGDLRRAIVEFRAAQRDDDRPPLDYNLGVCFERLGDAARAVDAFRRFLARQADVPDRPALEARIAALEQRVGVLMLVSSTPEASFTVDDEAVLVPADRLLRLTAGHHHVVASKEGYRSHALDITVLAGARVHAEFSLVSPGEPREASSARLGHRARYHRRGHRGRRRRWARRVLRREGAAAAVSRQRPRDRREPMKPYGLTLLVLCASACSTPTEIVLVVSSDLAPSQLGSVQVAVAPTPDGDLGQSTCVCVGTGCPSARVSVPITLSLRPGHQGEAPFRVVVDAFADLACTMTPDVEARAQVRFVSGERRELYLPLETICVDKMCPVDETCDPTTGACVSDQVTLTPFGSQDLSAPRDGFATTDMPPADLSPIPSFDVATNVDVGSFATTTDGTSFYVAYLVTGGSFPLMENRPPSTASRAPSARRTRPTSTARRSTACARLLRRAPSCMAR